MHLDYRPLGERSAADRYGEPSLFCRLMRFGPPSAPPRMIGVSCIGPCPSPPGRHSCRQGIVTDLLDRETRKPSAPHGAYRMSKPAPSSRAGAVWAGRRPLQAPCKIFPPKVASSEFLIFGADRNPIRPLTATCASVIPVPRLSRRSESAMRDRVAPQSNRASRGRRSRYQSGPILRHDRGPRR